MDADKLSLIEEIRKRPILWDVRKERVESNWSEIADILGVDVSTCKSTWKSLGNCYRIEKKNIQNLIAKAKSDGKYNNRKICYKWRLFEDLKFAFDEPDIKIADRECPPIGTIVNFEPNDSEDETRKRSDILCRQETQEEKISNDFFLTQSGLHIKKAPDPIDRENSNGPYYGQVYNNVNVKSRNILGQSRSYNDQSKHSNDFEDNVEEFSKLIVDNHDLDYSFLISFLYHMKLMSPLQKIQFRANMTNLVLNSFSVSASVISLENQMLLVDVGDSDGNFLISFWPFLKSMSWSENLKFRSKIADLMLNILSNSSSGNKLSRSTMSDEGSNLA